MKLSQLLSVFNKGCGGRINGEDVMTSTGCSDQMGVAEEEEAAAAEWEMRPGGMLVQKRLQKNDAPPPPNVWIRVAYGALRYQISVNSQATFGELKKILKEETGLEAGDQRLVFRGKERVNREYLDLCGVKHRSKILLTEHPISIERKYLQMRNNARINKSLRTISDISMEIDKLYDQVTSMEESISLGKKVPEVQITTLIEVLMRQAIKLDDISAEGDASSQQIIQVKCVETLDLLLKVSKSNAKKAEEMAAVTSKWETFDPPLHQLTTPSAASDQWEFFN
ncbi:BAG family molecular chaperone regulator 3 [Linum perenne]